MPDPSRLRDSTQIVLPVSTLADLRTDVEAEFTVTIVQEDHEEGDHYRIIGSPVEIKDVSRFLARHGVSVP
ncbi:hypothetical protein ACFQH6_10875 [Halobacteriaceae archaeon GCM10025711]